MKSGCDSESRGPNPHTEEFHHDELPSSGDPDSDRFRRQLKRLDFQPPVHMTRSDFAILTQATPIIIIIIYICIYIYIYKPKMLF